MIGEALVKRLSCIGELSSADERALLKLGGEVRHLSRFQDVLVAGEVPKTSVVLFDGYLQRYSALADGSHQVHSFYIPTDAPSVETLHLDYMDNNLGAVVDSRIGIIQHADLYALMSERPNVLALIWRETLVQAATFREWLMRNSRLSAEAAMAHLFCETFQRASAAGRVEEDSCEFPVTQELLGSALGLTSVHVNRTLQLLRETRVVEHKAGRLIVRDFPRLAQIARFDAHYLHLRSDLVLTR